jgi:two-component system response regulator EvgA
MCKVLIVEDEKYHASSVKNILVRGEFEIVAETHLWRNARDLAQKWMPDLVVLDIDILGSRRSDFAACLDGLSNLSNVIIIGSSVTRAILVDCLRIGAAAFFCKEDKLEGLCHTARVVINGYTVFPNNTFTGVREKKEAVRAMSLELLSPREKQVFYFLVNGWRNREIADEMSLSHKTVSTHKMRIFKKLELSSVVALADLAKSKGGLKLSVN